MPSSDRQSAHRAQLAAIVDSSDDAIVSKTLEGVITSWNRGAMEIFGYTADEAVGRHISLIIPEDRLTEEEGVLARLRNGEKIDHFETIRRTKDGRLVEISLTVSPVRDDDGRIIGASKVARDVTQRNAAQRALTRGQRRYRRLFDSAAVSLWEEDFSPVKAAIDAVKQSGVTDFRQYLADHPEFVHQCLGLVRVIDVNRTTLQMFGARNKRELLQNLSTVFDEASHPVFVEELVAIFDGRKVFEAETTLRSLSGERLDVLLSIRFPEIDASDDPNAHESVLVSLTDITLRRKAEDAVREETQIRETLARVGASLASELNSERLVQLVVSAATQLTSAEHGAFSYTLTSDTTEPEQLYAEAGKGAPKDADAFLAGSYLVVPVSSRTREVVGQLSFGHSRPGVFTARHEQLAAGIATWAALALDNARLYKSARDANVTKDEFLATLSHELRTPLNAMLGWTHLLRSGSLAPEMQQRALTALERNGRSQAQLVDDLLDVSRIVSGRLQIRFDDVDLAAVITSALDTIRPAAAAKLLDLRVSMPDRRVMVRGDVDRLRQIFWNLLSNAVKFTPPRGRIEVEARLAEGEAEIVVRDTGLGIKREFLKHVFERFRQADSSHGRKYGGLGIGLAIVRHLAEAHGGSVQVESAGEGQGATFSVRLPALRVHQAEPSDEVTDLGRGTALAGLQILVVEDERDAREFLGALLTMHGARVVLAGSAGEALGQLAGGHVDVLLADLGLPDKDGYALIQAIRSLAPELGGAVPAVAVTAYAGLRERARAFEAGYGWHVAKPVDPDQLLTIVTTAARSRDLSTPTDLIQAAQSRPEA